MIAKAVSNVHAASAIIADQQAGASDGTIIMERTGFPTRIARRYTFVSHGTHSNTYVVKLGEPSMLRTALSALALAVLLTGLGLSAADAKHHKKRHHVAAPKGCTASPLMRDESRLWACYPVKYHR